MEYLVSLFQKIAFKKIVIIGLNGLTEQIVNTLPLDVSFYVDINGQNIGKVFNGKQIRGVEAIDELDFGHTILLISGGYSEIIDYWLRDKGLCSGVNYWYGLFILQMLKFHEHNNKPFPFGPIVIQMDGGLGSQMVKYAMGISIENRVGKSVKYDLTWFDNCGKDINNNENRLLSLENAFNISVERASFEEIINTRAMGYWYNRQYFKYDENVFLPGPRYIDGYFCNQQYWLPVRSVLQERFTFRIPISQEQCATQLKIQANENSVAVHVRRGDYVGSIQEVVSEKYYNFAIQRLRELLFPAEPHFFIFSNGFSWVKQNLLFHGCEVTYVEHNLNDQGYLDMALMSDCKHFIIANSSFGWWPAWLNNKQGYKIAPNKWINESFPGISELDKLSIIGHDQRTMFPNDWIEMPV